MRGCKVLDEKEVRRVLAACQSHRERVLVLVGLYFGPRISEALALDFGDFEGDFIKIERNKGSRDTILRIPDRVKEGVKKLTGEYRRTLGVKVDKKTPLFLTRSKKRMGDRHANRIVREIFERAGIKGQVGYHSFRKCFTTKIFEMTDYNLVQTAQYSGHKNLTCLQYYIETTAENNLTAELAW
jgi:integrase